MSWTISHRQAGVTRGNVGGLIRHNFRDVDRQNNREVSHSNERIDSRYTGLNRSVIFRDGQAEEMDSTAEILAELDSRLAGVSGVRQGKATKLRADAGVVREIVMTLDPNFSRSSMVFIENQEAGDGQHSARVEKHFQDMIDFYGEVYGHENLLAASLHLDETTPHVHLLVTPIAEYQGVKTIRQESFISAGRGPNSGLAKNDLAMRGWMRARGYDADPEPRRLTTKNMTADELEALDQQQAEAIALEDRSDFLDRREAALVERESDVDLVAQQQQQLKAALEARESALKGEIEALPRMKSQARSEGHTEGYAAGYEQGQDAVAMARQQQEMMTRAHAKRLAELEEQANNYVESQTPPMPPMDAMKKSMSAVPLEYISRLDKKRPGHLAAFDKFAKQFWEQQVIRKTGFAQTPKISLEDFKVRSVDAVAQEQAERSASFQEQLRKHDEKKSQQQAWKPDISGFTLGK